MKAESEGLLEKAARAIRAAEILLQSGDPENSVGRAYYGLFHTAQALLRARDLKYRKHSSVHAAYGEHFAKTAILDPKYHRWLLAAFNKRLEGDYMSDAHIEVDAAASTIEQAKEFLQTARQWLEAQG